MGKRGGGSCVYFCVYLFHNVCLRFQTPGRIEADFSGGHLTGIGEALIPEVKVDRNEHEPEVEHKDWNLRPQLCFMNRNQKLSNELCQAGSDPEVTTARTEVD